MSSRRHSFDVKPRDIFHFVNSVVNSPQEKKGKKLLLLPMADLHSQLFSDWNSFCSALPHTKGLRDGQNRPQAAGNTFTPAIQDNFSKSVLTLFGRNQPSGSSFEMKQILKKFHDDIGGGCGKIDVMLGLIESKGKDQRHLPGVLLHLYTMESFFYRKLNQILRKDDEAHLTLLAPFINCMIRGFSRNPFSGKVYRGFKLSKEEQKHYRPGLVFVWPGFTSCSKNRSVAETFASGGILFEIEIDENETNSTTAMDVSNLSYFKSEDEVLLAPSTSLTITSTKQTHNLTILSCQVASSFINLTGLWTTKEDRGSYYVSQIASNVVWFAHGSTWGHVFFGKIEGKKLKGTYADLPINRDRFSGELVLDLDDLFTTMKLKSDSSGIFGGKSFLKQRAHVEPQDRPHLEWQMVSSDRSLTGKWKSNLGMIYFLRCVGDSLFWFAFSSDWSAANVFWGKKHTTGYQGLFSDVILSSRFRYSGKIFVEIKNENELGIRNLEGEYACRSLTRQVN